MKATKLVIGASLLIALAAVPTAAADPFGSDNGLVECIQGTPENPPCGSLEDETRDCANAIETQENIEQECVE